MSFLSLGRARYNQLDFKARSTWRIKGYPYRLSDGNHLIAEIKYHVHVGHGTC